MKIIKTYIKFTDWLNSKIGSFASWLTIILVIIVCYDVVSRYLCGEGSVALQELEWHIFSLIFLLGAAYTLKTDDHVRVDLFYTKLSARKKAWVNLLGSVLFLIPFCLVIIISSENFVLSSFRMGETSPDAGGLPARYVLKAVIPISFFLLLLEGVSQAFKSIIVIKEKSYGKND